VKKSRNPNRARSTAAVRFGLLTFAGLADIAQRELEACHPRELAVLGLRNHDLIVGEVSTANARRLAELRTVEDTFYMMGGPLTMAGRHDLAKLDRVVSKTGVLTGIGLKNALYGSRARRSHTFNCFVKQDRDREVRRKQIARGVVTRVASCFPKWRNSDPAAVEFWGFYIDRVLHLGLRLSDERMKYRGREPQRRQGSLRPTIAAALALLADPRPGSLVVDPMCGTGTILEEAFVRERDARYVGGDSAQDAVDLAGRRLGARGIPIRRWNAKELPLDDAQADAIVCNLPFGKTYSTARRNPSLYRALLSNWRRKLKPGGRMVLLTSDSQSLERCLSGLGLAWRKECRVKALGVWAAIYVVDKAPARR
jgi:SAM-dependent methyltransferase